MIFLKKFNWEKILFWLTYIFYAEISFWINTQAQNVFKKIKFNINTNQNSYNSHSDKTNPFVNLIYCGTKESTFSYL